MLEPTTTTPPRKARPGRRGTARPGEHDLLVAQRLRELRLVRGLTQAQMAELMGVTYQQEHKYERGVNRISAGRLWHILQVMKIDPATFFEGCPVRNDQRSSQIMLEMARTFNQLPDDVQVQVVRLLRLFTSESGENP